MVTRRIVPALAALLLSLALWTAARADIAPPAYPPGANPGPGSETTQVSMLAEKVLIEVLSSAPSNSLGQAKVTADFTMRNLGDDVEKLAVRFPISANDGRFNVNEVKNLKVEVNGKSVPTRRVSGPDPYFGSRDEIPWAEFDARFAPGKDEKIRVTYLLEATGYSPFAAFYYILETGAGWKGPIGSADLIVRLPYEATPQNVLLSEHTGWSQTTPGAVLEGRDVRWQYTNLEPTQESNLEISIVQPSYWKKVLNELENTTRNPRDGEAWGRLGRAYKDIAFFSKGPREDPEGEKIFELSRDAYIRCLELLPDDALWHSGYAELLLMHYNTTYWDNPTANEDLLNAVREVQRALEIDPNTSKALELADELTWIAPEYVIKEGDQYVFLAETATPAPTDLPAIATAIPTELSPTPEPTAAPALPTPIPASPTSTAAALAEAPTLPPEPSDEPVQAPPEASPTAAAAQETNPGGPSVCGIGFMVPAALCISLAAPRLRKTRKNNRM